MNEIILSPNNLPKLSKESAASFHQEVKERIFEHGGEFEYIELIKFFAALDRQINGDKASKIDPDAEFIEYVREQIAKQGNGGDKAEFKTARGVKFTLAEVGTIYNFDNCNDVELAALEIEAKDAADKVKERKEFLKTVPASGLIVTDKGTGETYEIFPPSKSSKSSFKVYLP